MKKIRMLLPTGAVIGMLVVGTAFPAMAAADSDTAKFVRGTTINAVDVSKQTAQQAKKDIWKVISTNTTRLKYRTRTATWKS